MHSFNSFRQRRWCKEQYNVNSKHDDEEGKDGERKDNKIQKDN